MCGRPRQDWQPHQTKSADLRSSSATRGDAPQRMFEKREASRSHCSRRGASREIPFPGRDSSRPARHIALSACPLALEGCWLRSAARRRSWRRSSTRFPGSAHRAPWADQPSVRNRPTFGRDHQMSFQEGRASLHAPGVCMDNILNLHFVWRHLFTSPMGHVVAIPQHLLGVAQRCEFSVWLHFVMLHSLMGP